MKKQNLKGMTLVEVTVALAVFAILVAMASGIIVTAGNIFAKTTSTASAGEVARGVADVLNSRLAYATDIYYTTNKDDEKIDDYDECIKIAQYTEGKDTSTEPYISLTRSGVEYTTMDDTGTTQAAVVANGEVCDTGAYDIKVTYVVGIKNSDSTAVQDENKMTSVQFKIKVYDKSGDLKANQSLTIDLLNNPNIEDYTFTVDGTVMDTENDTAYICYNLAD